MIAAKPRSKYSPSPESIVLTNSLKGLHGLNGSKFAPDASAIVLRNGMRGLTPGVQYDLTDDCMVYQDAETGQWVNVLSGCGADAQAVGQARLDAAQAARADAYALMVAGGARYQPVAVPVNAQESDVNQSAQSATGFFGFTGIPSPLPRSVAWLLILVAGVAAVAVAKK